MKKILFVTAMAVMLVLHYYAYKEDCETVFTSFCNEEPVTSDNANVKYAKIKLYNHRKNVYATDVTINGKYRVKDVVVDTGCSTTCLTYADYLYMMNNKIISEKNFVRVITNTNSEGKHFKKHLYKIKEISIGSANVRDCYCMFDLQNKSNTIRMLGLNFLNHFTVQFDFQNYEMILSK